MKLLSILVLFIIYHYQQTMAQATILTDQTIKVLHKGDVFKSDQDYRLLTVDELKQAIQDRADLKTLRLKEVEYKTIIKNDSIIIANDSMQIKLLNDNINQFREMSDLYHNAWLDAQNELSKKVLRHWYENKALWFCLGAATIVVSSEVVSNVK